MNKEFKVGAFVTVRPEHLQVLKSHGRYELGNSYEIVQVHPDIETVKIQDDCGIIHTWNCERFILLKEKEMLQRDKEYDVKLTGEEIAWLHFATARSCDTYGLYDKIRSEYRSLKLTTDLGGEPQSRTCGTGWDADYRKDVYEWLNKVFATPETEDQRKLRELKEQYESLGKAIDAMEKK